MNIEYYEWKKSIIKDENFTKDIQSNQICRPKLISNKVRKYFVHVLRNNHFRHDAIVDELMVPESKDWDIGKLTQWF